MVDELTWHDSCAIVVDAQGCPYCLSIGALCRWGPPLAVKVRSGGGVVVRKILIKVVCQQPENN